MGKRGATSARGAGGGGARAARSRAASSSAAAAQMSFLEVRAADGNVGLGRAPRQQHEREQNWPGSRTGEAVVVVARRTVARRPSGRSTCCLTLV